MCIYEDTNSDVEIKDIQTKKEYTIKKIKARNADFETAVMKNKYSPTKKTKLPSVNERKESLDASSTQELGDAVSAAERDTNRKKYTYHNSRVLMFLCSS